MEANFIPSILHEPPVVITVTSLVSDLLHLCCAVKSIHVHVTCICHLVAWPSCQAPGPLCQDHSFPWSNLHASGGI